LKHLRIRHAGDEGAGEQRADAGDFHQPAAGLARPRRLADCPVVLEDLRGEQLQLGGEHRQTDARRRRQTRVARVGDDREQARQPLAADRRDDAESGHVRADGVAELGALARQHQPDAVQHQDALLLDRLRLDEAHRRPADRLADRLCVGGVVLLPLDVRLDVSRRHQPHGVAERQQFARPMVRRRARLDADQAAR
jgi:hypothetical protein